MEAAPELSTKWMTWRCRKSSGEVVYGSNAASTSSCVMYCLRSRHDAMMASGTMAEAYDHRTDRSGSYTRKPTRGGLPGSYIASEYTKAMLLR